MAKKKLLAAATLATVTAAGVGTAASAMASGTDAPSATAPSSGSTGTDSAKPADGKGRHEHTTVTGTEADKVKAAVTAKFAGVTVERVLEDPDGSYDVMGTKSGNRVGYEVSKDLKTVTERTGGPGREGHGGPGGHQHTTVTGTDADKVKAAVTAKFAGVTVERVLKDPDGSYDVMGTKSGNRVGYEVSKDLKTVTERTGAPGRDGKGAGNGDGRGHGMGSGESGQSGSASAAPSGSASA